MSAVTDIDSVQGGLSEPAPEVDALACETLAAARSMLAVSYRFLDRALWKMPLAQDERVDLLGTDGREVHYRPDAVLKRFSASSNEAVRDYLHMICHCIFYHPFVGNGVNPLMWDLACDLVVEAVCLDLAGKRFPSTLDARRAKVVEGLKERFGNLSAEKIYRAIVTQGIRPVEADTLKALFIRDDHGLWYHDKNPVARKQDESDATPDAPAQPNDRTGGEHEREGEHERSEEQTLQDARGAASEDDATQDGQGDGEDQPQPQRLPDSIDVRGELEGDADSDETGEGASPDAISAHASAGAREDADLPAPEKVDARDPQEEDAAQEWSDISKQVKMQLETRAQLFGTAAGGLVQMLRVANRRKTDYRTFLRRFAQLDEEMTVNDDEFDLVYYSYGLRLFGNMPLVEPLEYRETRKVREFVIAIDTSGSVEGALVKRFVSETYSLLKSTESFFAQVNIRIMQCDAHVQSDVAIHSVQDFDRYMDNFELRGFGGTDFRPVFQRIDEHVEAGDFENLRGLIYFTDGYGSYPQRPPDYETVFVFADEGYSSLDVPPWAMRVYLDAAFVVGTEP